MSSTARAALLRTLHAALLGAMRIERRIDPFFRGPVDAVLREPLTRLVQAAIQHGRVADGLAIGEEQALPGEAQLIEQIIAAMALDMRQRAATTPGGTVERAGNTKTHGIVRGELIVHDGLPAALRHGLFAQPKRYPALVRFAGPGSAAPPDIDDVGVLSLGVKVMGVEGPKLIDDERFTQDFTAITTPVFTTPDLRENVKLQAANVQGLPLFYFIRQDGHWLDLLMQALWSRTQSSPLETPYWSCVPYALGEGQAMQYSFRPTSTATSRVPDLPGRPPDNYLRDAMVTRLADHEARFDMLLQLQTDAHRMPIENASVRWAESLSASVPVATLRLPRQRFDSLAQLSFAKRLSINPWHGLVAHRPLGNQNRGRLRIYEALSRLRQQMNGTPHVEPTGDEVFADD